MRISARSAIIPAIGAIAAGLIGAVPGAAATAATTAKTVTVRIDGLNRDGKVVAAQGVTLVGTSGFPITGEDTARVTPQRYLIGAQIPTLSGQQTTSETLVVASVRVRAGGTITLNARHGRLLRVSLAGATAGEQNLIASACLATPGGADSMPAEAYGSPGVPVYVVPMTSGRVSFSYLDQRQSASGVSYDLFGSVRGRIPSAPVYRQDASRLARVDVVLKGGADPTANAGYTVQPGNNVICDVGTEFGAEESVPLSAVDYRTAGVWTTDVTMSSTSGRQWDVLWEARRYQPGRRYSDAFGGAVVGPSGDFPRIEGNIVNFTPNRLFADPNLSVSGGTDASTTVVTLRLHGHLVHRQKVLGNCSTCFQTTLHRAGWYEMSVGSHRSFSAGLLSPTVQLTWRFHVTPTAPAGQWVSFPLTETVFQPEGLNLTNQAPANGHTTVRVLVDRAGTPQLSPAPKYPLRTVQVEISTDGGETWKSVRLTKDGGAWLATIPDPASGYVSLRSVVTDTHGDSTIQTIDRAFAISG
jgi:hypothetical protein